MGFRFQVDQEVLASGETGKVLDRGQWKDQIAWYNIDVNGEQRWVSESSLSAVGVRAGKKTAQEEKEYKEEIPGLRLKDKPGKTEKKTPFFEEEKVITPKSKRPLDVELTKIVEEVDGMIKRITDAGESWAPSEDLSHNRSILEGWQKKVSEQDMKERDAYFKKTLGKPYNEAVAELEEKERKLLAILKEKKIGIVKVKNIIAELILSKTKTYQLRKGLVKEVMEKLEIEKEKIDQVLEEGAPITEKLKLEISHGQFTWLKNLAEKVGRVFMFLRTKMDSMLSTAESIDIEGLESAAKELATGATTASVGSWSRFADVIRAPGKSSGWKRLTRAKRLGGVDG